MESFIKLLNIAKQNITNQKNREKNNMLIEMKSQNMNEKKSQKIYMYGMNSEYNKVELLNNLDLCIEYIDFINEFNLTKNPSILEAKLCKENKNDNNNILAQNEEQKQLMDNSIPFPKNIQIDKDAFNKGNKKIIYIKEHLPINIDKNQIYDTIYKILINFGGFEFYALLDFSKALNNCNCNILELPLYKKDEQGNINEIYGLMEITLSEIVQNSNNQLRKKYEEYNRKYLKEPLLLIKEDLGNNFTDFTSKNSHFGLTEPNVYRRKIMNAIHNNKEINIDINNMENCNENDLNKLYQLLYKECAVFLIFNFQI